MENNTTQPQPVQPEQKPEQQAQQPQSGQQPEQQAPKTPYSSPIDDLKNKISSVSAEKKWAMLCYIPVFNLLTCPLVAVRMVNSKFCRFHSRQGLTLFGLWIVTIFVALFSQTLSLMLWGLLIALHIAGAVFAYMNQETKFPILGDLALKIPEFYLFTFLTGKKFDEKNQQMVEKDQAAEKGGEPQQKN